ncbi:hypothetical protein Nepgr_001032 [Nepenthes gracilis]|uniref:Cation-transporting P-type ATPase N-terminal domain-containing protein n=1 Tax=Nepenthes gracilis TaxID=150966 RepID=A0AAD3RXA4_NEPGR|nr:hypothetical protein Nepgr_001032 [Nepenthes gracilis]
MGDKAMSLEDIRNENVDLEKIPLDEVFEQSKSSRKGLSSEEGANRLQIFGPNKLEERKVNHTIKFAISSVICLYSVVTYLPLDPLKFAVCYVLSGSAWDNLLQNRRLQSKLKDGLRLRELHTLKEHAESVVKLKGLDINTIQQHYTV